MSLGVVCEETLPSEQRQWCVVILGTQRALLQEFPAADFSRHAAMCCYVSMSKTEPIFCATDLHGVLNNKTWQEMNF